MSQQVRLSPHTPPCIYGHKSKCALCCECWYKSRYTCKVTAVGSGGQLFTTWIKALHFPRMAELWVDKIHWEQLLYKSSHAIHQGYCVLGIFLVSCWSGTVYLSRKGTSKKVAFNQQQSHICWTVSVLYFEELEKQSEASIHVDTKPHQWLSRHNNSHLVLCCTARPHNFRERNQRLDPV